MYKNNSFLYYTGFSGDPGGPETPVRQGLWESSIRSGEFGQPCPPKRDEVPSRAGERRPQGQSGTQGSPDPIGHPEPQRITAPSITTRHAFSPRCIGPSDLDGNPGEYLFQTYCVLS